jgi:hypothetical protein
MAYIIYHFHLLCRRKREILQAGKLQLAQAAKNRNTNYNFLNACRRSNKLRKEQGSTQ